MKEKKREEKKQKKDQERLPNKVMNSNNFNCIWNQKIMWEYRERPEKLEEKNEEKCH